MTAQAIMSQIGDILKSANSIYSSNPKGTADGDFSSCLSGNLRSEEDSAKDTITQMDRRKNRNGIITAARTNNQVADSSKGTNNPDKSQKTKDISKDIYGSKTDNNKTVTDGINNEKLSALSGRIESMVKETLDISEDELNQLMSVLGLTMLDLLDPKNLIQLVLGVSKETDITAVLTNESLSDQLAELSAKMGSLNLEDFNLTEEELESLLNQGSTEGDNEHSIESVNGEMTDHKAGHPLDKTKTADSEISFAVYKEEIQDEVKDNQKLFQPVHSDSMEEDSEINQGLENGSMGKNKEDKNQDAPMTSRSEQFINNLSFIVTRDNGVNQDIVQVTQMRDIVNQIVKEIKIHIKPESSSMELHLNPENLGKVNLAVASKDGILTARFTVQNSVTKEAIESQIQILKDNLNQQGVKVEAIEVTVSNFTFSEGNQTSQGEQEEKNSKKPFKVDGPGDSNENSAKEDITDMMNGSTVSYTA